MSMLLQPAVSLANRMSFSAKLTCVVLIFLLPFLWLLIKQLHQHRQAIDTAEGVEHGVTLALAIKPLALDLAKHRGTMAQYLNGATDKADSLRTIETALDKQLQQVSAEVQALGDIANVFASINSNWQSLKVDVIAPDAEKSFGAHTELIEKVHQALVQVADYYDIELLETRDQYYLMQLVLFQVPELQELLGQLRGKGAGALTDKNITPEERATLTGLRYGILNIEGSVKQQVDMLYSDPGLKNYFSNAYSAFERSMQSLDVVLNQQLLTPDQPTTDNTLFFNSVTEVIDTLGVFDQQASQLLLKKVEQSRSDELHAMWLIIIFSSVCMVLGCYMAFGILRALNISVQQVNSAAQQLKAGDFSRDIRVNSRDVIGEVASNLSAMVQQVSNLIIAIQNSANDVNKLSIELQTVTDSTKVELDQQNNQTQQSASAATEMAATVREVARTCVDTSSATDVARDIAREGQKKVNDAIQMINRLGNDVSQAKNIISQLQSDVTDISAVLEVIRSIAEQTNLLALNAAIEAARAGEQGRGFAVVADEVRSLARRTQDSTAEIKTVIEKLQTRAATAVDIILHSFHGSQQSVQSAASAGESLQQIVQNVEMLRDLNTQIATAAEEQATVAEEMSRSTRELGNSAENILGQVEQTLGFSITMRRSASQLLENTLQFKT